MNKNELIECIAQTVDQPKAQVSAVVEALFATITTQMSAGHSITLVGFGTFAVKNRPARIGRNPKTGESIAITAAKIPGFKAGKNLKERVNG